MLLAAVFSRLLALWPFYTPVTEPEPQLEFTLRHIHAHKGSTIVLQDVPPSANILGETSFKLKPQMLKTFKPRSQSDFFMAQRQGFRQREQVEIPWDEWEIPGPNTSSRDTLSVLAKMTWNAYLLPDDTTWYDLGDHWSRNYPFGWEPDADGFRGHVFVSSNNDTVVVSIKGTSAGAFGGGPTTRKDKLNDNLMFSCCCARVGPTWSTVCGCYQGGYKCDQNCLEEALIEDSLFYPTGTNLYNNISYMYPDANVWLTGHSLGGSLASLIGVTFGLPTVAFEAPGDRLAARRLHLPQPPSLQHVTHVFHTADPIPMGTCTGVLSSCAIAGYAMESKCHLGKKRLYDTVTKYGWSQDVRTHRIGVIIDKLLAEDWEEGKEVPDETMDGPECDQEECYSWQFGSFRNASYPSC